MTLGETRHLRDAESGTPPRVNGRDRLERQPTLFMDLEPADPPQKAADLAYSLLMDSIERDMDYEEFTFELEGGPDDGVQYKVIVMKV